MPSITNYVCPACGGPLHFDAISQKLKCDYCGSVYTNEEIESLYGEKNEEALANTEKEQEEAAETLQWTEEEKAHMRAYECPSCGAQIICDEYTASTSCPYCGNNTIVPAQFAGTLRPDYVIPFQLTKDDAIEKLKQFYKGKPLLPSAFKDQNHIEEIKGMYVPFWLYNGSVHVDNEYHGTRVHTHRTSREIVTVTEHYKLIREGTVTFEKVPADASSKMPDEFMDAIEPFDYSKMTDFNLSYMPGYLADKYDVSSEEDAVRANRRMKNSASTAISQTLVGFAGAIPEKQDIQIKPRSVYYAFLPVWMLSTQWNGKNYLFAMNGQSGKMIGDLPTDYGKFILYFVLISLAGIILLFFLLMGGHF